MNDDIGPTLVTAAVGGFIAIVVILVFLFGEQLLLTRGGGGERCYPNLTCDDELVCYQMARGPRCEGAGLKP